MKRNYWLYPESNLMVEKYSNVINREHLDALDGYLFSQLDHTKEILALVDLNDATLFNINYGEIAAVFDGFLKRLGENNSAVKVAIYCGEIDKDDYLKISTFSKYETDRVRIDCFSELLPAFNWLGLPDNLRDKIIPTILT